MMKMRVREGLEEEKRRLAEWAHKLIPNFVSPGDYAPKLSKITHKIFIPTDKPSSTYMGFIIGPRGRTQKKLEQETRCKIVIRGKGATKAGYVCILIYVCVSVYLCTSIPCHALSLRSVQYHSDDDEPIHVLIEGDKELDVINAAKVVEALLGDFHPVFEEYKKEQLRIVAELNGITREGAGFFPLNEKNLLELYDMDPKDLHREISQPACFICKEKGHAPANCPKRNAPKDKPSKDKALEDFMKEIAKPIVAPAPAEPIPVPLNPSGKVGELYQYMYQLGSMK